MSLTPFHDMADALETIAANLRAQGDAVHLGTFEVPVPAEEVNPPAEDKKSSSSSSSSSSSKS
jgi:hypothetical protein